MEGETSEAKRRASAEGNLEAGKVPRHADTTGAALGMNVPAISVPRATGVVVPWVNVEKGEGSCEPASDGPVDRWPEPWSTSVFWRDLRCQPQGAADMWLKERALEKVPKAGKGHTSDLRKRGYGETVLSGVTATRVTTRSVSLL